jgi:hypothetical protein
VARIYRARTLAGAEKRVRQLQARIQEYELICKRLQSEQVALAMLAAGKPMFYNPIHVAKALKLRDAVLRRAGKIP